MDTNNASLVAAEAIQAFQDFCRDDPQFQSQCQTNAWLVFFLLIAVFITMIPVMLHLADGNYEGRGELMTELRNSPSWRLHQDLEDMYRERIGIQTRHLKLVKRYPSVTYIDDPVAMKRTITVVEDLAWVEPVNEELKEELREERRAKREGRDLRRQEEDVGLILRELGMENDQELKAGNGITGHEQLTCDDTQALWRHMERVRP
jgi:hypothetical protein